MSYEHDKVSCDRVATPVPNGMDYMHRTRSQVPMQHIFQISAKTKITTNQDVMSTVILSPLNKKSLVNTNTDKVLTFLQNARQQNTPVRSGKWNHVEEIYLRELVRLFTLGILDDLHEKSSMRGWLSSMLNCCPMRISKKQLHGENFAGKRKYKKDKKRIEAMTQQEYDETCANVFELRLNFLKQWARDEFSRRHNGHKTMRLDEWYSKVLTTVPQPKVAKNDRLQARNYTALDHFALFQQQIDTHKHRKNCQGSCINYTNTDSSRRKRKLEVEKILPQEKNKHLRMTPARVCENTREFMKPPLDISDNTMPTVHGSNYFIGKMTDTRSKVDIIWPTTFESDLLIEPLDFPYNSTSSISQNLLPKDLLHTESEQSTTDDDDGMDLPSEWSELFSMDDPLSQGDPFKEIEGLNDVWWQIPT